MKTPLQYAHDAVDELSGVVGMLAAALQGGIVRPRKAAALSLDRILELNAAAALERAERDRNGVNMGETPAPLDLDVMDQLVEVLTAADRLSDRVAVAAWRPVDPPARSAFDDPRPRLRLIRDHLHLAAEHDPTLPAEVESLCRRLHDRSLEVLGLTTDGQVLEALCPWCDGRTEAKPTGGVRTLRVRNLPSSPEHPLTAIVCEGGQCAPPDADVSTWWRGQPAWLDYHWDWLATQLRPVA